jgi:uncharacterized membrane protein (DUF485 family)
MEISKPGPSRPATGPAPKEVTADDGPPAGEAAQWEGIERTPEFMQLVRARMRFVIPATVFFLVYYFLLPLLNGLAPAFMRTDVIGHINIAYLFALSEFVMAWVIAYLYIRQANSVFDPLAEKVRQLAAGMRGGS